MNRVLFSRASDLWTTPPALFQALDARYRFGLDAAATADTALCPVWLGPGSSVGADALGVAWATVPTGRYRPVVWCNPPYARCRDFVAKAAEERTHGCTVVCLVPARTDTRWWHDHVWHDTRPRVGVTVTFVRGRLRFGSARAGAPFPSALVTFTPRLSYDERQLQSARPPR
jgi:site-specific DNA-methyltransferase (adenine-specific)